MKTAQRKREYIREYKLSRGCAHCGFKEHFVALELDHLYPGTVSANLTKRKGKNRDWDKLPWVELEEELKLCQVLCSNCHRIKTHLERDHLCKHEK